MNTIAKKTNKASRRPEKIFIGVSWPYASGNIHLGHLAGQYVVCDIFARYHRLKGNQVLMVSGSDSHGAPVIFAAEEQGITPEDLAERSNILIMETYRKLGFLYENYTSTHTKNHEIVAQNLFLVLEQLGFLQTQTSNQYYDPKAKRFLPDRYVRGTCPHCKATNARGDECPECGEMLDPIDLIDPYSTLSDSTPKLRETNHYYFNLDKAEAAITLSMKNKTYWRKWVKESTEGWLRRGLRPRAVTRDFDYGIPVPADGWNGKVLYVFFEAVMGYLSAAIEWADKHGAPSAWEDFWKDPACKHYYFVAGGNVPFHTIIWPAEIIGYNKKYQDDTLWKTFRLPGESLRKPLNLPYDVPANNMLTYRGRKMSKGDKTGIGLDPLLKTYGPDLLRYFFARFAPENDKRELTWKDFIDANNNELVANIGNFINRVLTFTHTRFEGKVPEGKLEPEVKKAIQTAFTEIGRHIERAEFVRAVETLLDLGHFANKYFNDEKPWASVKTDISKASSTIYNSLQIVSALRILLKPLLPFSADKLSKILHVSDTYDPNRELQEIGIVSKHIDSWVYQELPSNHKIGNPEIVFAKHEYSDELRKEDNPNSEMHTITTSFLYNFPHIDARIVIGKVKEKTDARSRVVRVDIGSDSLLTIVCKDADLKVGQVVPVALPGAKLRSIHGETVKIKASKVGGIRSDGMLCDTYELGVGDEKDHVLELPGEYGKSLGTPLANMIAIPLDRQGEKH